VTRLRVLILSASLFVGCGDPPAPIKPPPPPEQSASKSAAPAAGSVSEAEPKAEVPEPEAEAAEPSEPAAPKGRRLAVDFEGDSPGGPSADFEAIIGDWYVGNHEDARGLWVDGTKWRQGTPSASLADQAKRLYGEHYAEFLDNVKAFAFYPVAVWKGEVPEGDLEISVRFYPESGRIDQAAGIVWSLTQDGRYWGVRANPLEDNILYFDVERGKRKVHATIRGVPTPTRRWHTLEVTLADGECVVVLDGQEQMSRKLTAPVSGRIGLWSKADSKVLFDDFVVESIE